MRQAGDMAGCGGFVPRARTIAADYRVAFRRREERLTRRTPSRVSSTSAKLGCRAADRAAAQLVLRLRSYPRASMP
jgi:hypothetical protein